MRECQQNRWQRGAFEAGDHRGGGKDERVSSKTGGREGLLRQGDHRGDGKD